jgi:hypothetical protein
MVATVEGSAPFEVPPHWSKLISNLNGSRITLAILYNSPGACNGYLMPLAIFQWTLISNSLAGRDAWRTGMTALKSRLLEFVQKALSEAERKVDITGSC